jgi:hypothetical protein
MRTHTISERVTASFLGILLVSCTATRQLAPTSPEELTHFVLFIREQPNGTVSHSWQRVEELDLSQYRALASVLGTSRAIVPVMGWNRDCDEENSECIAKCMRRPLPRGYGHMTSNGTLGSKASYCRDQCWQPYRDCMELEKLRPQEFTAIDPAIDWLKRNRRAVLVGSVVVVAGVALVVLSAGAGVVILAPALLFAVPGSEVEVEPFIAEVSP